MRKAVAWAGLAVLLATSGVRAQAPARFRWAVGQVLLYQVEHSTVASDVMGETKNETKSLLKLTKRWQVTAVDPSGTATLQLSLTALMQELTTPKGEVLRYDSADPDKSTPQLKASLSAYVNQPLGVLRVDALGRVVEVKESKFRPASAFDNELPFLAVLPAAGLKPGQTWERSYRITVAPPAGTGEKYEAVQRYACTRVEGDLAYLSVTTEVKDPPKVPADGIPLWQWQPKGEVVFDLKAGRLHGARLTIDKELKGHEGEGSACRFQSTFTLRYAGDR
jgi:hypothetical protein